MTCRLKLASSVLSLLLAAVTALGADAVNLRIRVILIDSQLNQKPVPRFSLLIQSQDPSVPPYSAKTNFDGIAELMIAPGKYTIASLDPIVFEAKEYQWRQALDLTSATTLDLSNDNASSISLSPARPARVMDELSTMFGRLKNSVVTVWSETGHGTGFIVDSAGLIVTNEHVVAGSNLVAVQFDERLKVRGTVLASSSERDIAILRVAPGAFEGAISATIAQSKNGEPTLVEGERVFTIGSPLNQRKVITSGIVSKLEAHVIISDLNINHGNSGGPLFNSIGEVVGVTTFGDMPENGGPGISGIVRIEDARALLDDARRRMTTEPPPDAALLPVEPTDAYPLDAIRARITAEKFDMKPYQYGIGGFDVFFSTPLVHYRLQTRAKIEAVKGKDRRNRRSAEAIQGTFNPGQELRSWEEYVGEYKPQLLVRARPQLREGFLSALGRGLAMSQGMYGGPASMAFQADFYRMKLFCGSNEIQPIQPGKAPIVLNEDNAFFRVKDATYEGAYFYPYDAIAPTCGVVQLQLFTEKKPTEPIVLLLSPATIKAVWGDFEPYRDRLARGVQEQLPIRPPADPTSVTSRRAALDAVVHLGMTVAEVTNLVGAADQAVGEVLETGGIRQSATYSSGGGGAFTVVFVKGVVTSVTRN